MVETMPSRDAFWLLLIPALLVGTALLWTAVRLLWGRRVGVLPVGLALAALLLVGVLGAFFASSPQLAPVRANAYPAYDDASLPAVALPAERPPPFEAPASQAGSAWSSVVDASFEADVYPSMEAAVLALTRQVAPEIRARIAKADGNCRVLVMTLSGQEPLFHEAAQVLGELLEDTSVLALESPHNRPRRADGQTDIEITAHLAIRRREQGTPWDPQGEQVSGDLEFFVNGVTEQAIVGTRFMEKPWVERFGAFAAAYPGGHWLAGYSAGFADTAEAARRQALADAANHLAPLVRARMQEDGVVHAEVDPSMLLAHLTSGDLLADQFVQRLSRPYGDVWRAAVLVGASPAALADLAHGLDRSARHAASHARHQRQSWAGLILSVAGLLAVVMALYAFLNLITRGYYQTRLRLTLLAALTAGAAVTLLLWT